MQTLELHDGTFVEIAGHLNIKGKTHFIVVLPTAKMVNERLVTMVIYPLHYFKNTFKEGIE